MKAPHLNRALILQKPEQVSDGMGGFSTSWLALGQIWAEVKASSGREVAGEERALGAVSYRITTRALPARPQPGQRLVEGGRVFAIRAVAERDQAGLYLVLWCQEEVAA